MKKKTDLRVLRTKKSIRKAFLDLLKFKNYNKITIQDIAEEAMINRNTFYLHYLDKDDLLEQLTKECLSKLKASMNSSKSVNSINELGYEEFYNINNRVFDAIEDDFDFYKVILGDNSLPYVTIKFTTLIKEHMSGKSSENVDISLKSDDKNLAYRRVYVEYMAAGLIGVIGFWINNREQYSKQEISRMVINMYEKDVLELLRNNMS